MNFYPKLKLKGKGQKYDVWEDYCYDLPEVIAGKVKSVTIDQSIWRCTFFPNTECEGEDKVYQLGAGEYADLFGEGSDFVPFKCAFYKHEVVEL